MTQLYHPKYRADIDGLRAIAVLSVVLFHTFPNNHILQGGFVGVDIFFVISGFLISTILFNSLENNTFSFTEFYAKRIKRIFPALIVVLVTCLIFGWFILIDTEYEQLGKHIKGAATYTNNFQFWKESGYFDTANETKVLLNLWSLSIEEQFYILWPFLLWVCYKRKFNLLIITTLLTIVSFALHLNKLNIDKVAAFYSPQLRFWELLIGSLIAYLVLYKKQKITEYIQTLDLLLNKIVRNNEFHLNTRTLSNVQSLLGLSLILVGIVTINKTESFPGWNAMLYPVLGTALVISSTQQAWVNKVILAIKALVWFGLISYPLYLWHWPLLAFTRILTGETPSLLIRVAVITLSIILAALTYYVIEKPIRFGVRIKFKTLTLIVVMLLIGFIGHSIKKNDGLTFRQIHKFTPTLNSGFDGGTNGFTIQECGLPPHEKKYFEKCEKDIRGNVRYAVIGDSKALAIWAGLVRTSTEKGRWMFIGNSGWLPTISTEHNNDISELRINSALHAINENPDIENVTLVMSIRAIFKLNDGVKNGNLATYNYKYMEDLENTNHNNIALKGLNGTIDNFIKAGKSITIVTDNPALPNPEDCITRKTTITFLNPYLDLDKQDCHLPIAKHIELTKKYRDFLAEIKAKHPNSIAIFDTEKYLCNYDTGYCDASESGRLLYAYTDHISDYAAGKIGANLNLYMNNHSTNTESTQLRLKP
jgi:peptidoglycan/LPS O-acetylase OafA/YrhL